LPALRRRGAVMVAGAGVGVDLAGAAARGGFRLGGAGDVDFRPTRRMMALVDKGCVMRELIERYLAAYNRMDVDGMLATMHREVVFENYTAGVMSVRTQGADELRHLAQSSSYLFSARRQLILAYEERDGTATAHILFDGTFAVDLPNGVRAGQSITLNGRSEFRARDGLLVYIGDYSE